MPEQISLFDFPHDRQNPIGGGSPRSVGRVRCIHSYNDIISLENLLGAWKEFRRGKRKRKDVLEFERNLMRNIISLHSDLVAKSYKHSPYEAFNISDPKPRNIHKATVRDRLLHHAVYRKLYPFFDKTFIADSYSCRIYKGSHKSLRRFRHFADIVSKNNTCTTWILKCDVRKFFASIDQSGLIVILEKYLADSEVVWLLSHIVKSFQSSNSDVGLPLGNLTSQLLVNIYMNKFDQFIKHELKAGYYIRYADDFVIFSRDKNYLERLIPQISSFLKENLKLSLHPDKVFIKTLASGVDFLGWVHFPHYRVLRGSTRRKMIKRIKANPIRQTIDSYCGLLGHGNTYKLRKRLGMPK